MDRLTRLRAPLAVVALAALTLTALARVGLGLSQLVGSGGSAAVGAARLAPNASDAALTVLVGVLVVACALPPEVTSRRRLAVWGVVLVAVSVVATAVALSLTDLAVAGWSLVWLVPDVVVPVVVGVGLLGLARPSVAGTAPALAPAVAASEPEQQAEPTPDPALEPSWTPDAAAGAVWRTAGEAARGAPASGWGADGGWGRPADPAGWSVPAPVEDPEDERRP